MGRQARKLSATGVYHIVFRGINRQHLFEDERNGHGDRFFVPRSK